MVMDLLGYIGAEAMNGCWLEGIEIALGARDQWSG
jgi:hypothetical protein